MFTSLLQSLFGTRTPSDLARSTQGRWDDWLRPISEAAPAGVDIAYDDDFLAIKDEVAKLSEIDDELIVSTAERFLKHSAKDVRVATYYVYGRMRRDGAEGVADGMELLSALVAALARPCCQSAPKHAKPRSNGSLAPPSPTGLIG